MQGDLNVSVLVHELDTAVKAIKNTSHALGDDCPDDVVTLVGLLVLVLQILEDESDH